MSADSTWNGELHGLIRSLIKSLSRSLQPLKEILSRISGFICQLFWLPLSNFVKWLQMLTFELSQERNLRNLFDKASKDKTLPGHCLWRAGSPLKRGDGGWSGNKPPWAILPGFPSSVLINQEKVFVDNLKSNLLKN